MILIYPHIVGFQLALEPSTSSFHSFTGYFDGANKTISGLYVDESSEKFSAGLFGHVSGIEIKNVIIKDGYIKTEATPNSSDDIVRCCRPTNW